MFDSIGPFVFTCYLDSTFFVLESLLFYSSTVNSIIGVVSISLLGYLTFVVHSTGVFPPSDFSTLYSFGVSVS